MKCSQCEEIATVFCNRFDETEGTNTQVGYCNQHASEDVIFAGDSTSCSNFAEFTEEQLAEFLLIVRATGAIPKDSHLPSGKSNPFYLPSAIAARLTAEDIQRIIDDLSELGE